MKGFSARAVLVLSPLASLRYSRRPSRGRKSSSRDRSPSPFSSQRCQSTSKRFSSSSALSGKVALRASTTSRRVREPERWWCGGNEGSKHNEDERHPHSHIKEMKT